jgi:flagellar biosynthesis protein FlhF
MPLEQFIANSAADAAQQVRAKLGAAAVVVNVRQLPSRWFQKPRIEVLAHVPEPQEQPTSTLLDCHDEPVGTPLAEIREIPRPTAQEDPKTNLGGRALLESLGLLPLYAEQVIEQSGTQRPAWMADELKQVRAGLAVTWVPYHANANQKVHVFIGTPGVGKTTVLCKWLTLEVLLREHTARVWRLDGETANTAEALSMHGDVLGVTVERSWANEPFEEDISFIDLPGVNYTDAAAMLQLEQRLKEFGDAQIHLVLNAAYESSALLAQARAFTRLPVADIIVTHLDEEVRWGKLWNLALGTGCPIRYLSAGQNIPGEFIAASTEYMLERIFPTK